MKKIMILGAGFMQGVAIRSAKDKGWRVTAVDGNPLAPCRDIADRFEPIDLKDTEALISFARSLYHSEGLDGVFTAATDFSLPVALIADACGLPGHTPDAARAASDKLLMRSCFAQKSIPSPLSVGVTEKSWHNWSQALEQAGISIPVVVKPVDNMGARGCRLVRSEDEMSEALEDALRYSRTSRVIVEEYMDGPEFSLEALVYDGEFHLAGCADRHIFFPPYFIEMGHTIPSSVDHHVITELVRVFQDGIRALGLTHGVAKGDLKLTSKGPMIGEIAARLSGGYMSGWTYPYSSGVNLTSIALDLAVGIRPQSIRPTTERVCAERAWISIPGRIRSVNGLDRAATVPGVRDVFPRSLAGDLVVFPRNNVEKCGNCLAVAPDTSSASQAAEQGCREVFLRLEPHNRQTETFLQEQCEGQFPPSAFTGITLTLRDMEIRTVCQCGNSNCGVPSILVPILDTVKDWHGQTLRMALGRALVEEPLLLSALEGSPHDSFPLWRDLLRGGIQGIVYRYDCRTM